MSKYTESDLLRLAKRFHNTKRTYLLVDPLQGKHLSVSPSEPIELFHYLGREIRSRYDGVRLVIGFAETATAVGMAVAEEMSEDCVYIHTTREDIPDVSSWIEFAEEHSHAVDQKLDAANIEGWINATDSIVFVDDEISTGKTLINFIKQLKAIYPGLDEKKLIIASIINRLSDENKKRLAQYGIECVSVLELEESDYEGAVKKYSITEAQEPEGAEGEYSFSEIRSGVKLKDPRRGLGVKDYIKNCTDFSDSILKQINLGESDKKILVMGTEECMYPAIMLGKRLEALNGVSVYTHSTTRSPIGICDDTDYPVKNGFKLHSVYDSGRATYIYNLIKYDRVFIVTDSKDVPKESIGSLTNALRICGNNNILLIRG